MTELRDDVAFSLCAEGLPRLGAARPAISRLTGAGGVENTPRKSSTAPTVPPIKSASERVRSLAMACFVTGPRCCMLSRNFLTRSRRSGRRGASLSALSADWSIGSPSAGLDWDFSGSSSFMIVLPDWHLSEVDGRQNRLVDCGGVSDLQKQPFG